MLTETPMPMVLCSPLEYSHVVLLWSRPLNGLYCIGRGGARVSSARAGGAVGFEGRVKI